MNRSIRLYNILLEKNFTPEEAETVVSEVENTVHRKFETVETTLASKDDLHKLTLSIKDDMNKLILWMVGLILGQTGLIFLILQLVGVFE